MTIIAIANQKGGVGKTSTAVNVAAGLATHGKATLLIDLDPQANASFTFLPQAHDQSTIYDVLTKDMPIGNALVNVQPNLDMLPSSIDLAAAEVELISEVGGQTMLKGVLQSIMIKYDFIIIDAPPSLGMLTINALACANFTLIPVGVGVYALKGLTQLQKSIAKVKQRLNPQLQILGILLTFYDHTNVAKDVHEGLQNSFGDSLFDSVIPKNVQIEEAHSRHESVLTYAPQSKGAVAYFALVEEVLQRVK